MLPVIQIIKVNPVTAWTEAILRWIAVGNGVSLNITWMFGPKATTGYLDVLIMVILLVNSTLIGVPRGTKVIPV